MKKILGIVAMMMLVPMAAFSMEAVSDAEMEAVSGAGVNIDFGTGATAAVSMQDVTWSNSGSVKLEGIITTNIVFADVAAVDAVEGVEAVEEIRDPVTNEITTPGVEAVEAVEAVAAVATGISIDVVSAAAATAQATANADAGIVGNDNPAGVQIGMKGLSVGVNIPSVIVDINGTNAGTLGGNIGVNLSLPDVVTISAYAGLVVPVTP